VAAAAGLDAADLVRAARAFAAAGHGYVVAGTGPHMANHGTLLEYLALCLDTLRGHWMRAGETVHNAGVLGAPTVPRAQASEPGSAYGFGERSRVRGLGMSAAGMPSATLAEEILLEGPGRVRSLVGQG
jgi:anaerobic selenocysteine-containing dehydrogenase